MAKKHFQERPLKPTEETKIARTKQDKLVSWRHPGGKLLRLGHESLTDAELLAILIGAGSPKRPAQKIAEEVIKKFQSFRGLADQPLEKLMEVKGLKQVKVVRIAAAFEIARRIVKEVKKHD